MTRFPLNQIKSNKLDFWAYMNTLSTSAASKMGKLSIIYSIYNSKIESFDLSFFDSSNPLISIY